MEAAVKPDEGQVWDALGYVIDPEVGLDIVTMGLVYGVDIEGGDVTVRYTLTTPGCPMEGPITESLVAMVYTVDGVENVEPRLVWEPAWNPGMIAEGALQ